MEHDLDALRDLLRAASKNGRIPCSAALRIAGETGVPSKLVGATLDELEIRIIKCQLGCFE